MKSVLISIQPKWCELIASGKKTIEVRKTRPKLDVPFKVYIYCTQGDISEALLGGNPMRIVSCTNYKKAIPVGCYIGNGKVIGEFVCDRIDYWQYNWLPDVMHIATMSELSCVSVDELLRYSNNGKNKLYGWHISNLVIYDKPKELSEFEIECKGGCDIPYVYCPPCEECQKNRLKRPPQSWCYVKEGEK